MSRREACVALIVLSLAVIGCNKSDGDGSAPTASIAGPGGDAGAAVPQNLTPQETVTQYLKAVKAGDEKSVGALLTETARKKTEEANIAVAPPGSETAEFSVGDMEYVTPTKDTAHVACMWTDLDEQGKPQTLNIVWVVRHEPTGWRIAGMITRIAPDQPLLVLDFEDPEEVIRRQATAQEAMAKRNPAETQATTPAAGATDPGMVPATAPGQPAAGLSGQANPAPPAAQLPTAGERQARGTVETPVTPQR